MTPLQEYNNALITDSNEKEIEQLLDKGFKKNYKDSNRSNRQLNENSELKILKKNQRNFIKNTVNQMKVQLTASTD